MNSPVAQQHVNIWYQEVMQLNLAKEKRVENIHFQKIFQFEILNVVKKKKKKNHVLWVLSL